MYNFEVANSHSYFVGKLGLLVHNNNACSPLQDALSNAKRVDDRLETMVDDHKVIFRQDTGAKAHPLGAKYPNPVDHYNVEIHAPRKGRPGKFDQILDGHLIVDSNGKVVDIIIKEPK